MVYYVLVCTGPLLLLSCRSAVAYAADSDDDDVRYFWHDADGAGSGDRLTLDDWVTLMSPVAAPVHVVPPAELMVMA